MRNISYDTTDEEFKQFMEKFGQLKYGVLCKSKDLVGGENGESKPAHKGTGFVQFRDASVAQQLVELSQSIE